MINIGVNLDAVSYWSTEEPFIDRIHTAQGWVAKDASGNVITSTLAHDANGDITNLTGVNNLSIAVAVDPKSAAPIDQYVMTYDGTADVKLSGAKIISQTAGKVVFEYTGGDAKPSVFLTFKNLSVTDPISDVHVVRVDQQAAFNAGEIFNPDFVAKIAQLGIVRFMDWGNTNESHDVSWATRTTLDDTFWSKQATTDGVPLEAMVKLANEAHVDMWYNVPTKADDAYVKAAMTYIRDHLDPGLKVHVEYSNEVWNSGFSAFTYAQNQANALWGHGTAVQYGTYVYYGYRSAQIANIAHDVFTGNHSSQLVDVLGGHASDASLMKNMLVGISKAGVGSASALFKDLAIAPYFGSEMGTGVATADLQTIVGWAKSGAAGMDAAFKELEFGGTLTNNASLAKVTAYFPAAMALAKASGLNLVAYEGGISLATTKWNATDTPIVQDFFNRLLADPRMGVLYAKEIAAFTAAGGTEWTAFNDTGTPGDSGSWGMLSSIYSTGSQRWDAVLAAGSKTGATTVTTPTDSSGTTTPPVTTPVTGGSTGNGVNTGAHDEVPTIAVSGHIVGTDAADNLVASAQNDTVEGAGGDDVINGSSSTTDAHGNLIETDVYMGGAGSDTIVGGDGNDHIYGNALTTVAGTVDGADSLMGGGGMDYIQGNAGNDTIDGGDGNDRIYGGADDDSLLGGNGNDYLQGNRGNDVLSGGDGNDTLHGGADNDVVHGDAGNDQLFGDAGNDTLVGGTGIDVLTGGAGSDTFVFSGHDAAFATSGTDAWKTDEVTDFAQGTDKFEFDFHPIQVLGGSAASAAAALTLANSLASAHHGETDVAAITVGNDTYLFWDATGQGGAIDSAVKVDNVHGSFSLADFA